MVKDADGGIPTTHIGSLPRPPELVDLIERQKAGEDVDSDTLDQAIGRATAEVIQRQQDIGLDFINNGEQPRVAFNFYVEDRLSGIGGEADLRLFADLEDYREYAEEALSAAFDVRKTPGINGPIEYADLTPAKEEIDQFYDLLGESSGDYQGTFITSASPGTVSYSFGNLYYDTYEEYLFAIAEAMQTEYELIAETDADLQLDAPDLLMGAHHTWKDRSVEEFKEIIRLHIEAINEATASIPRDRIRLHTCWGNYEGPHNKDLPLEEAILELYEAEIGALSIEQANPNHQHEYRVFGEHPLPDGMDLMPGVIDTTTNLIEHPKVVADRLERVAQAVGDPSRIIAAPDCGFDTFADRGRVNREIVWGKLEAMVEGAALASERLW